MKNHSSRWLGVNMSSHNRDVYDGHTFHSRYRWVLAVGLVAVLLATSGCGWIFHKAQKDLTVVVKFVGTDSLNFDGERAQAVEVKAFVLTDSHRFMSADPRILFDPSFEPTLYEDFQKKDVVSSATAHLSPLETESAEIVIPYAKADKMDLEFAAIANFFHPPSGKRERVVFKLRKKPKQTITINVGKDWVAQD